MEKSGKAKAELPKGKEKMISIRGVNAELYAEFVDKIKSLDLNVGDAFSKLMLDVIKTWDNTFPEFSEHSLRLKSLKPLRIQNHDDLTISRMDLIESGRRVIFRNCQNLHFEPDIDKITFQTYIVGIQYCNHVKIPKILPKLLLLSLTRGCENLEFYEID